MKANAPDRIWIDPTNDLPKLCGHIDKDSVEYTRTDAFIEKACEFIETYPHLFMGVLRSEVIEDFDKVSDVWHSLG